MAAYRTSIICYQSTQPDGRTMRSAFTLIELTVTLCILSILSAIALPRAQSFLDSIRLRGDDIELETWLSTARHLQIPRSNLDKQGLASNPANVEVTAGDDT